MCTAVTYKTKEFYFGRTLDYEFAYPSEITLTPRRYPLKFRRGGTMSVHHALIGMAYVVGDYPLYYDGMNEKGLCMAGLNFVGNAVYQSPAAAGDNVAQFEFIPWILGQCATVAEARAMLARIRITDTPFSAELPVAELHWMIADRQESITVESVESGLMVYDNPVGVLTNNPTFPEQLFRLNDYMHLSPGEPGNQFSDKLDLRPYSRGMGALGLPGDLSSPSRFVRASFVKMNSVSGDTETESVGQFFHILGSVEQQTGCCIVGEGEYERTIYTSCCSADRGIYYYTTYENPAITAVDMMREDLDGAHLVRYPMLTETRIDWQNGG